MGNINGLPDNMKVYEQGQGPAFIKDVAAEGAMPNSLHNRQYFDGKFIASIKVEPSDAHLYNLNLATVAGSGKEAVDELKNLFVAIVHVPELQFYPWPKKDDLKAYDEIARNGGVFVSYLGSDYDPAFGDRVRVSYSDPLTRKDGVFEFSYALGAGSGGAEMMLLKAQFKQMVALMKSGNFGGFSSGGKVAVLAQDSGKYVKTFQKLMSGKIPEMCVWIDRSGVLKPDEYIPVCKKLGFKRIGLFITGVHEVKVGEYKPFGGKAKVNKAVKKWLDAGIGVDFTVWVNPKGDYLENMLEHFHELFAKYGQSGYNGRFRLCMDTEQEWKKAPIGEGHNKRLTNLLFRQGAGGHNKKLAKNLALTDHGGLQKKNYNLMMTLDKKIKSLGGSGCIRQPQAYAGGWSKRLKRKIHSKDIKFPTNIANYSMNPGKKGTRKGWHKGTGPLEMGMAEYNPVEGMSYREYILLQIAYAMKWGSKKIWVWQLRMKAPARKVFMQIKDGSWVEAKKIGSSSSKKIAEVGELTDSERTSMEAALMGKPAKKPSKDKVKSQMPLGAKAKAAAAAKQA